MAKYAADKRTDRTNHYLNNHDVLLTVHALEANSNSIEGHFEQENHLMDSSSYTDRIICNPAHKMRYCNSLFVIRSIEGK